MGRARKTRDEIVVADVARSISTRMTLESDLLYPACIQLSEVSIQGEIMSKLIDSSGVHYAVIKGCCSQGSPEPLVIAYADERSLRELIAAPSILGLRFDSRTEAVKSVRNDSPAIALSNQMRERAGMADRVQKCELEAPSAGRGLADGCCSWKNRRMIHRVLEQAAVMIALIFYSRNLVSAVIRTILGFPC
jgi:hypothetical protein